MTQPTILIVPGRGNSGAEHWQTHLQERFPDARRIEQDGWDTPNLEAWSQRIDATVRAMATPPLLVAHSFGCLAAAHAQITYGSPVAATLFVAPADPTRFGLPERIFRERLIRPGFLVASDNDPWMSEERAIVLATAWGIKCMTLKNAGHINVASGHGHWPLGEMIITHMRRQLARTKPQPWFDLSHTRSVTHPDIRHISK